MYLFPTQDHKGNTKFDSENPSKPESESSVSLIFIEMKEIMQQFEVCKLETEQSSCHLLCDLEVSHPILQQGVLISV